MERAAPPKDGEVRTWHDERLCSAGSHGNPERTRLPTGLDEASSSCE